MYKCDTCGIVKQQQGVVNLCVYYCIQPLLPCEEIGQFSHISHHTFMYIIICMCTYMNVYIHSYMTYIHVEGQDEVVAVLRNLVPPICRLGSYIPDLQYVCCTFIHFFHTYMNVMYMTYIIIIVWLRGFDKPRCNDLVQFHHILSLLYFNRFSC